MPAITPENVVIGVAWLYTHDTAGTAKPTFTDTPSGGWEYVGATAEGVALNDNVEPNFHYVEEQSSPVAATPGQGEFTVSCALAEATLENIALVLGGDIAGTTLTLSDIRNEVAFYVVGVAPEGDYRSFYVPRAMPAGATEAAFRRTEQIQLWNLQLNSTCRRDEIEIDDLAAA